MTPLKSSRRSPRFGAVSPPSASARIKGTRTVEAACFLRYCLLAATDQLILMVRRRVAELWRHPVPLAPNRETMQVIILPAYGCLDDGVEVGDRRVGSNQDSPPDRRTDAAQLDADMINITRRWLIPVHPPSLTPSRDCRNRRPG